MVSKEVVTGSVYGRILWHCIKRKREKKRRRTNCYLTDWVRSIDCHWLSRTLNKKLSSIFSSTHIIFTCTLFSLHIFKMLREIQSASNRWIDILRDLNFCFLLVFFFTCCWWMARVGRVQSMISRWYCSAAFLTSCILGNRCSTSIRGKDKLLICCCFSKWIVFQVAKDAQNARRWRTDASRVRKENEPNYFVGGQFHLQFETRFLAMSRFFSSRGGMIALTNSNERKFVGVRNDAFKCWHTARNTHRTTRGRTDKSTKLFTLLITASGCVHVGIASQSK